MDEKDEAGARVFPARAGMNRLRYSSHSPETCVPRPRGDEPTLNRAAKARERCSPPARG